MVARTKPRTLPLMQSFDLPQIILVPLWEAFPLGHAQERHGMRILGGLAPLGRLLWQKSPHTSVATLFRAALARRFEYQHEVVGLAPTLAIFLDFVYYLPLQLPGLAPLVERDHMVLQRWTAKK